MKRQETQRGGARKGGRGGGRGSVLKADYEQLQQYCTCVLQISISVVTCQEFGVFLIRDEQVYMKLGATTVSSPQLEVHDVQLTTVILYESGLRELEAHAGGYRVEEVRPGGEFPRELLCPLSLV